MGWLWGSGDDSAKKDAVGKLDSGLREFLENEPSTDYKPKVAPKAPEPTPTYTPIPSTHTELSPNEEKEASTPKVPKESLFPDGRYAHIWKNYKPQRELEASGKSDQEKLADIVDGYNDRRRSVTRAAAENCAFEHYAQNDCFRNPNWKQRSTMCHEETRIYQRCFETQQKFLKALNFLEVAGKSQDQEEKIQIQGDRLFRFMQKQEGLIEEAKKEGRPVPEFGPLLSPQNIAAVMRGKELVPTPITAAEPTEVPIEQSDLWAKVPQETKEAYEKKVAQMSPLEREVERKAVEGELALRTAVNQQLEAAFVEERIHRAERREKGKETFGDTLKRWWGWK